MALTNDFFLEILFTDSILLLCFLWVDRNYDALLDKVKLLSVMGRCLTPMHKKILKKHFSYYNKLSPSLQRPFEQRIEYFFFSKKYLAEANVKLSDKKKLLIAAYAAQLSFGLKDFMFDYIQEIAIYPSKFPSKETGAIKAWQVTQEGRVNISWSDFYRELRNESNVSPIGMKVMAYVIKMEKMHLFKQELEQLKARQVYKNLLNPDYLAYRDQSRFGNNGQNTDDFLTDCIIKYFCNPLNLKNTYPELFRTLDKTLYKGIA